MTVQVYESTTGLAPGQPVYSTGGPMTIQLGPGLLRGIFDGIARPLEAIDQVGGRVHRPPAWICPALDGEKKWDVHADGQGRATKCRAAAVIADCPMSWACIVHKCHGRRPIWKGRSCGSVPDGAYTVNER